MKPIKKIKMFNIFKKKNPAEKINKLIASEKNLETGSITDGYHTFDELYEFRLVYNALLFNKWAENKVVVGNTTYRGKNEYLVHKSMKHNDGEYCFGGGWFIVSAMLPSGQISNHYKMKDWDLFRVPVEEKALFEFDNHTSQDVLKRLKHML